MKKRVLSLILTIVLSACSIGGISAETVDAGGEYENAKNILNAIGAFERYDTGADLALNISRAEFISMCISVIYPGVAGYEAAVSPFIDVDKENDAYKSICTAQRIGIISGNGNGRFRPNEAVTYDEALKILISILGYDPVADDRGGFPHGYRVVANSLSLSTGVSKNATTDLKYGDCLVLLLNALNTEIFEIDSISKDSGVTFREGETLLYNSFRIIRDAGVLTENGYTTLTAPKKGMDNSVVIGNFSGKIYGGVQVENYLGYDVEFYYQEDAVGDYIVYLEPTSVNKVTYIGSEYGVKVSGNTISYYPDGEGKMKSVSIPGSAKVIYNGKAYPEYTMDIFEKKDADFRLIDNDKDGTIDVVNATVWNNIFIHAIDTKEEKIIDKYDGSAMIALKDADDYIIWDRDFNQLSLSEVKTGVVANCVKSIDGNYVRVIITDNKKSGTITTQVTKNGNTVLLLDGTEYVVSDSYAKKVRVLPNLGSSATFYLDYTGRIAAIESGSTGYEYGYIIAASDSGAVFGDYIRIKLLRGNGAVAVLETDAKLKVDGNAYNEDMFYNLSQPQIIRYKLSADEKIKEIDTLTKGENESENSLRALTPLGTMKYYPSRNIFAGSYHSGALDTTTPISYCMLVPDANTKLFLVPNPEMGIAEDREYNVTALSYFTGNATKVFQGYNANVDSYTPDVVYAQNDGGGNISRGRNSSLVAEVLQGFNNDEKVVTQLKILKKSGEELTLAYSSEFDEKNIKVGVGDFINYTTDMYNDISDINIIYSNELKGFHPNNKYAMEYFGSEFNPYYGKVYDKNGSLLVLETAEFPGEKHFVSTGSAPVYIVENLRGELAVVKGTVDDIYDTKHFGSAAASNIFYYTWQTSPQMIIVYR